MQHAVHSGRADEIDTKSFFCIRCQYFPTTFSLYISSIVVRILWDCMWVFLGRTHHAKLNIIMIIISCFRLDITRSLILVVNLFLYIGTPCTYYSARHELTGLKTTLRGQ